MSVLLVSRSKKDYTGLECLQSEGHKQTKARETEQLLQFLSFSPRERKDQ